MIIAKKFFQILMIPLFVKFWDLPQSWGGGGQRGQLDNCEVKAGMVKEIAEILAP